MATLESVLDATAIPHLPFLVVQHSLSAPPWPLVSQLLATGAAKSPSLLICALRPPDAYLPGWQSDGSRAVDLTTSVPGFGDPVDIEALVQSAASAFQGPFQAFIDAADVIAEDYSPDVAARIVGTLLAAVRDAKDLISASLSPALALLTPHHPRLLEHLARAYLLPVDASPRYWQILDTATARGTGDDLAVCAAKGLEVGAPQDQWAVAVLLRKPTGGAKALVRAIDGLRRAAWPTDIHSPRWAAVALDEVVNTRPVVAPSEAPKRATTHADLNLPFNLQLTDAQKAARGAVPLPYAHEGEGADLGMGMDWSDDEEDDEI